MQTLRLLLLYQRLARQVGSCPCELWEPLYGTRASAAPPHLVVATAARETTLRDGVASQLLAPAAQRTCRGHPPPPCRTAAPEGAWRVGRSRGGGGREGLVVVGRVGASRASAAGGGRNRNRNRIGRRGVGRGSRAGCWPGPRRHMEPEIAGIPWMATGAGSCAPDSASPLPSPPLPALSTVSRAPASFSSLRSNSQSGGSTKLLPHPTQQWREGSKRGKTYYTKTCVLASEPVSLEEYILNGLLKHSLVVRTELNSSDVVSPPIRGQTN